jgi:predicted ester cyclase
MGKALDLLEHAYSIYDSHDWQRLEQEYDTVFREGAVIENPFGRFQGREIFPLWQGMQAAFPNVRHEIVSSVEQGDSLVVVEGRWIGDHTGPLRMPDGSEVPPTGRPLDLPYAHVAELVGGRFSSWRVYFDTAAMMQQLGLMPEPAHA